MLKLTLAGMSLAVSLLAQLSSAQVVLISAVRSVRTSGGDYSNTSFDPWYQGSSYDGGYDPLGNITASVLQTSSISRTLLDWTTSGSSFRGGRGWSTYSVTFSLPWAMDLSIAGTGHGAYMGGAGTDITISSGSTPVFTDRYVSSYDSTPYATTVSLVPGQYTLVFAFDISSPQSSGYASADVHLATTFAPANGSCSRAVDISSGGTFYGTVNNTTNTTTLSCGDVAYNPDVWYTFTAPPTCRGGLFLDTCGSYALSAMDTKITVFNACGGTVLTCNDDSYTTAHSCTPTYNLDSSVYLDLLPAQTVLVRISPYTSNSGKDFVMHARYGAANETCATALAVDVGALSWTNCASTTDGPSEANLGFCCNDPQINNDLWWWYQAHHTGNLVVDTFGSRFDTKLAAYESPCPTAPNTAIAGNDDSGGTLQSKMQFGVQAGHVYLIRAGGYGTSRGEGVLNVNFYCAGDFNQDLQVDFFDYLDFANAFASNSAAADFNADGSIDFFDYLDFVNAFVSPC